jgi:hypothetical protein
MFWSTVCPGTSAEVAVFPRLGLLFTARLNSIFRQFALKIGMSANYEKRVPGNNEQISYWPILNFYSEIWRTRKKTISALKEIKGLIVVWDFDQGLLCNFVTKHVKHA